MSEQLYSASPAACGRDLLEDPESHETSDMQEHLARKILQEDSALQLAARRRPRRSDPTCHRVSSRDQKVSLRCAA